MFDPLQTSTLLLGSAASLAVVHTLFGMDHSLPFVALGRARGWSLSRTLAVTVVCGIGHVASSVFIGGVGVALGVATESMLWLESARGDLAASLLIGFGLAYAALAVWRRLRRGDQPLMYGGVARGVTPWALFIVFVLGPCEPLIPLMVVPGIEGEWFAVAAVVGVFGTLTLTVMLAVVIVAYRSLEVLPEKFFERHAHVAAGFVVAASGVAVLWLNF